MWAVLAALLLRAGPTIDSTELLTGGAYRPGHWAPLEVKLTLNGPFDGELAVLTDFGFTLAVPVRAADAGPLRVVIPVLALGPGAPLKVILRSGGREIDRKEKRELGRTLWQSDYLIGVDRRRDASGQYDRAESRIFRRPEPSGGWSNVEYHVVWFTRDPKDEWRDEYFEALDFWVGEGHPTVWLLQGGKIVDHPDDLAGAIALPGSHAWAWIQPVDSSAYDFGPRGAWIETKRQGAVLFAAVYLFTGLVLLSALLRLRLRPILIPAAAAVFSLLGSVSYFAFFPRGRVSVIRQSFFVTDVDGSARVDFDFVRRSVPGPVSVEFPSLVKPVFESYQQANTGTFELRIERVGCRVTADGAGEWLLASVSVEKSDSSQNQQEIDPNHPVFKFASSRLGGPNFRCSWLAKEDVASHRLRGIDFAEERARPPLYIQRLR